MDGYHRQGFALLLLTLFAFANSGKDFLRFGYFLWNQYSWEENSITFLRGGLCPSQNIPRVGSLWTWRRLKIIGGRWCKLPHTMSIVSRKGHIYVVVVVESELFNCYKTNHCANWLRTWLLSHAKEWLRQTKSRMCQSNAISSVSPQIWKVTKTPI